MNFYQKFKDLKTELQEKEQYRSLLVSETMDFCSNDYLGFAYSETLKKNFRSKIEKFPLGSTSSRLIRGQNSLFETLERGLAERCGAEAALLFPTGYLANLGLFSCLGTMNGKIFSDASNHASIIDGIRMSGCSKYIFPHNDWEALGRELAKTPDETLKIVVVESTYSMFGDNAPLEELASVCDTYGAHLFVDEAHATALFGAKGSGRVEALGLNVFARIHTAGKALGVSGAWISGPEELIQWVVNSSRPFIYSTGMSYPQLLLLQSAWEFWDQLEPDVVSGALSRVQELRKNIRNQLIGVDSFYVRDAYGPVISLHTGSNSQTLSFAAQLDSFGFSVKAVRPPTVPEGQGMLRVTVPGGRTSEDIKNLSLAIGQVAKGFCL